MNGHLTRYLFYEKNKKSVVTIPRILIEANNLNWNHRDHMYLVVKEIDGQKGLFLFKKEEMPNDTDVKIPPVDDEKHELNDTLEETKEEKELEDKSIGEWIKE